MLRVAKSDNVSAANVVRERHSKTAHLRLRRPLPRPQGKSGQGALWRRRRPIQLSGTYADFLWPSKSKLTSNARPRIAPQQPTLSAVYLLLFTIKHRCGFYLNKWDERRSLHLITSMVIAFLTFSAFCLTADNCRKFICAQQCLCTPLKV